MSRWSTIVSASACIVAIIVTSVIIAMRGTRAKLVSDPTVMGAARAEMVLDPVFSIDFRAPPILHQTWEGWDAIPDAVRAVIGRMRNRNPTVEYRFYDDADSRAVVRRFSDEAARAYDQLLIPAMRADMFRYCVLFLEGGFYLDIKAEMMEPLLDLVNTGRLWYGVWPHPPPCHERHALTSCIAWPKGHPVLAAVVQACIRRIDARVRNVTMATGPDVYAEVVCSLVPWKHINFWTLGAPYFEYDGTFGEYYTHMQSKRIHWSDQAYKMHRMYVGDGV